MLIDTHCHLDAVEFDKDRENVANAALNAGVNAIVVPAVERDNFDKVIELSARNPHVYYALGIHPMYVDSAKPSDLNELAQLLETQVNCVAVGEIGLDFFVTRTNKETQEYFFIEQLKLAQRNELPVILHVRKAIDEVLKYLRRNPVKGGIAHAFNGSWQQAEEFIKLGFKLGFGGAMTYPRALKIRELAATLPLDSIVLETDAPDIPPSWLGQRGRNSPAELGLIAENMAELRGISVQQLIDTTTKNAYEILPKLADLCTPLKVLH